MQNAHKKAWLGLAKNSKFSQKLDATIAQHSN